MTCTNITKDFQKTSIYPYNAIVFADDDFLPSFFTDRIEPAKLVSELSHVAYSEARLTLFSGQSVKDNINKETMLLIPKTPEAFYPETVRLYPKAAPRKINSAGRRKRKAVILTDTPERNILKQQQTNKLKKVEKQKNYLPINPLQILVRKRLCCVGY